MREVYVDQYKPKVEEQEEEAGASQTDFLDRYLDYVMLQGHG